MCKAIKDFRKECIDEGKRLGEDNALRTFIKNLLDKSFSLPDICVLTGAPKKKVQEIILALQQ